MDALSEAERYLPPELIALIAENGLNLVAAILILIAGLAFSGWAAKTTRKLLDRVRHVDGTLKPLLASLVRYAIVVVTVLAVLDRFGVETTSLIAVLGAAGLAVGLAIQGTLSNVAGGVMLILLRPFRVGDYITAAGETGTVREIGLFNTILITADLIYIAVPNSAIFGATIENFTREPTRRVTFTVGIDYSDDIDKAQAAAIDTLRNEPRILEFPEPEAPVVGLGESAVELSVRGWVKTPDYWPALWDLQKKVKQRFDAEGIRIPFPQRVVTMRGKDE